MNKYRVCSLIDIVHLDLAGIKWLTFLNILHKKKQPCKKVDERMEYYKINLKKKIRREKPLKDIHALLKEKKNSKCHIQSMMF